MGLDAMILVVWMLSFKLAFSLSFTFIRRLFSSSLVSANTKLLEWAAIPFCKGSSWHKDWIMVPALAGWFLTTELPGNPLIPGIRNLPSFLSNNVDFSYTVPLLIATRKPQDLHSLLFVSHLCSSTYAPVQVLISLRVNQRYTKCFLEVNKYIAKNKWDAFRKNTDSQEAHWAN